MDCFVDLTLKNFKLTGQIKKIAISSLTYSKSTIGDYDVNDLKAFFNVAFRTMIPIANQILVDYAQDIPTEFLDFIVVKDATFASKAGYLAISMAPDFYKKQ